MNSVSSEQNTENICPHLGLSGDPQTKMGYPSSQNICYHVTPPASPGLSHQHDYCLQASYTRCKLFAAKSGKSMSTSYPVSLDGLKRRSSRFPWLLQGFLLLVVVAAGIWMALPWANNAAPAPTLDILTPTVTIPTVTLSKQADEILVQTPVLTLTNPPAATFSNPSSTLSPKSTVVTGIPAIRTSTPERAKLLETPFGPGGKLQLHRVMEGESLDNLANKYKTSVEAIRVVNYNLPMQLWINYVLVIPINQLYVTGIKPMYVFSINIDGITIESLAQEKGVNLDEICTLNDLSKDHIFLPGEYVVLPQPMP